MKDLYAKLGLEPDASAPEIAQRLKQKPELAVIGTILLNPGKRAVYDSTHSTLKTIGALRHRLGLDKGETWFLQTHPNFAPSLTSITRARQAPQAAEEVTPALPDEQPAVAPGPASGQKSLIKPLSAVIVIVALLAALYFVLR